MRRLIPLVAAVALAVASGAAAAVGVTLNVKGGYANRTLKACALTHHYTLVHPGRAIGVDGAVSPAPTGAFRFKLKVKQCIRGRFRTVWIGGATMRSDGTFRGTLPPRRRGYYFARAYYYKGATTVRSDKQYFRAG